MALSLAVPRPPTGPTAAVSVQMSVHRVLLYSEISQTDRWDAVVLHKACCAMRWCPR